MLSDIEIDKLAEAVARKQMRYNAPVLTAEEAMHYVGKKSEKAFRDWRKKLKVPMCTDGRYSRRALEMGMNKESRLKHSRKVAA